MQENIFRECYNRYLSAKPGESFWVELAEKFGYESHEALRKAVQRERQRRNLPSKNDASIYSEKESMNPDDYIDEMKQDNSDERGESIIKFNFPEEQADILVKIFSDKNKTDEDILKYHGYDVSIWKVSKVQSNVWHMPSGNGTRIRCYQNKIIVEPKKQITINDIDRMFRDYKFEFKSPHKPIKPEYYDNGSVLEIDFTDFHFGSAGAYDTGISVEEKVEKIVNDIFERASTRSFSKILIVLLGDTLHFDTKSRTTTGGTPVTTDGRTPDQIHKSAFHSIVNAVNILGRLAPIEIISVNGNHDYITSQLFILSLWAYFKNDENITVDTTQSSRKTRLIGNTLLGFSHGDISQKKYEGLVAGRGKRRLGQGKMV